MRARFAALAPLLLASCAFGRPRLSTPACATGAEALPSGIQLVAYALPHRPDTLVAASYRVGSARDPAGKEGLAHLVEHLSFRARHGGGRALSARLEAEGVEFDGRTSADATDFHAVGDPDQLDALLRIEADRLRDPLAGVDEAELRREREVVLQELALRGDPDALGSQVDWLTARALAGHPYGRIATPESLRAITLEDVRAFARAHYRPENLLLLVAGPAPAGAVAARARAALGELATRPGEPADPPVAPPELRASRPAALDVVRAPVERAWLLLTVPLPGDAAAGGARAYLALRALEAQVEQVLSGPDRDRALSVELLVHGMDGASLPVIRIGLRDPDDARPLVERLRAGLRFAGWQGGPDPGAEELRDRLVLDAHVRLEAFDASEVARWIRLTGRTDYLTGMPAAVGAAVTPDRAAFARRWLREERLVALAVVPGEAPRDEAPPRLAGASALDDDDPHGAAAAGEPAPARDAARAMRPPHLDSARRRRLKNGVRVIVSPRPGYRVLSAHLVVRTAPAGPLERVFEVLALRAARCADRPATVGGDRLEFGARAPTELVDLALAQVACRAGDLAVDAAAFERERDAMADALRRRPPTLHETAGQQLLELLYPGHPYSAEVTEARVRAFRAADAGKWLGLNVRPERAALVIAGDVEATDALFERIEQRLGRWRPRGGDGTLPARPPAPLPGRRELVVVDRPGWRVAEVLVGVRVPPRGARDEAAFRTLSWRLQHVLTARLREGEGLTYRVSLSMLEQSLGSALVLSTAVDRARAGEALAAVLAELAASARPLDPEALARARWRAVRRAGRALGTSWRNALRLTEMFVHGLPPDEWDTFAARAAALDARALVAEAGRWALGREAIVVVGDAAVIAPALEAAGLPARVLPAIARRPPAETAAVGSAAAEPGPRASAP
ncbi:M16 family metallopeptidase [Anaeromyxobacter dehalogenans]|nr:insulinase family protein [Anaeromyxobacter dehalogenans]